MDQIRELEEQGRGVLRFGEEPRAIRAPALCITRHRVLSRELSGDKALCQVAATRV